MLLENGMIKVSETAHPKMSPKYKTVQTNVIAKKFKDLGFVVDEVLQRKTRKGSGPYAKHMVRLSHPTLLSSKHQDVKLQLIVTNSFDGSASFSMQLGFFRFVCANGMIVGEHMESFKHKHNGNILEEIDASIDAIVAQAKGLSDSIEKMKSKNLTTAEIIDFEKKAMKIRSENLQNVSFKVRRSLDVGNDLYTVYNRIQEDLVRGGIESVGGNGRTRLLREVKGIDKIKQLNEKLFDLAMSYAA